MHKVETSAAGTTSATCNYDGNRAHGRSRSERLLTDLLEGPAEILVHEARDKKAGACMHVCMYACRLVRSHSCTGTTSAPTDSLNLNLSIKRGMRCHQYRPRAQGDSLHGVFLLACLLHTLDRGWAAFCSIHLYLLGAFRASLVEVVDGSQVHPKLRLRYPQ